MRVLCGLLFVLGKRDCYVKGADTECEKNANIDEYVIVARIKDKENDMKLTREETLKHMATKVSAGITVISEGSFYCCKSLSAVILPDTLEQIDSGAFCKCASLHEIIIPASVKLIDEDSFEDCPDDLIIIGETGSFAEEYAEQNDFAFKAID